MGMNQEFRPGFINKNEYALPPHQILSPDIIGKLSEVKVACALRDLPAINKVNISENFSKDDMLGRDLTVNFKEDVGMDMVWVQVKTSHSGMEIYRECMAKMLRRKKILMDLDEWFTMNRLVLIVANGYSSKQINDSFEAQVERINKHSQKVN